MKLDVIRTDNDRLVVIVETASGPKFGSPLTPEEAVAFAIKLSNLAYPLTKAVQRYTNGGCHR